MLKINKILPKNKARHNDDRRDISCISRVGYLGLATLICGIMPGLMGLGNYVVPVQQASAVGYDITQISTMQEMTQEVCGNTEVGVSKALTDTRDGNEYTVTKLSDGKCWMAQNLRLAGGTVLSRTDTDLDPSVYTSDSQTYTLPEATVGGFSDAKLADSNDAEAYMNHQVKNSTDDDYGAYYSWCAATAGTCQVGSYADIQPNTDEVGNPTTNPANTTIAPASSQATSSICPKGWRLPTGGANSNLNTDFRALYRNYPNVQPTTLQTNNGKNGYWLGGDSMANGGAFFYAAGSAGTSSGIYNAGVGGLYWSSTASSATNAYSLDFGSANINPSTSGAKYRGRSIRCLASGWPSQDVNVVAVRVAPVISIDTVSGMTSEVEPHKVTEGTIHATVSANTTYDVLLSTNNTSLTNPENLEGPNIPAVSSTNPVQPNTNAWGIKTSTNTYLPITTTPTSFYNTTNYDETTQSTTHTFTIGVSVAPSLPAEEYSTTVTITAVNN